MSNELPKTKSAGDQSVKKTNSTGSIGGQSLKSSERSRAVSPSDSISSSPSVPNAQSTVQAGAPPPPPPPPPVPPAAQKTPEFPVSSGPPTVIRMYPTLGVFGPNPIVTHCSYCNCDCLTKTQPKAGGVLYTSLVICCIASTICGCVCCLTPIPALIEDFYDIEHICRNCGKYLGVYVRNC